MYNEAFCKNKFFLNLNKQITSSCGSCPDLIGCVEHFGIKFREWRKTNCKMNKFGFDEEFLVSKKDVKVLVKCYNLPEYDRSSKMMVLENGSVTPIDDSYTIFDFYNCLRKSAKRALDNFFGYALSNSWDYFFTFTLDPAKTDRYDYDAVSKRWTSWLKERCRLDPDIKVIVISEQHKDGAIHFHGFISNSKSIVLTPSYYPADYIAKFSSNYKVKELRGKPDIERSLKLRGTPIFSKFGDLVFNMNCWQWGFSTCCVLPSEDNQRRVVNYCVKYLCKQCNIGYRKKKFHRTRNLKFKDTISIMMAVEDAAALKNEFGFEVYKETDKFTVYRKVVGLKK